MPDADAGARMIEFIPSSRRITVASAKALAVYNGNLIVGGGLSTAGGNVSAYLARWGPTTTHRDFDGAGLTDLHDFSYFPDCLSGPAGPFDPAITSAECLCPFNTGRDADIDLLDVTPFQKSFAP